eukprot:1137034-Pelagomonas_calceolata.AAC.1
MSPTQNPATQVGVPTHFGSTCKLYCTHSHFKQHTKILHNQALTPHSAARKQTDSANCACSATAHQAPTSGRPTLERPHRKFYTGEHLPQTSPAWPPKYQSPPHEAHTHACRTGKRLPQFKLWLIQPPRTQQLSPCEARTIPATLQDPPRSGTLPHADSLAAAAAAAAVALVVVAAAPMPPRSRREQCHPLPPPCPAPRPHCTNQPTVAPAAAQPVIVQISTDEHRSAD